MIVRGLGTALKPAVEDWWLLRKPLIGTVVENVLKHGTGGINVDACRIQHSEECRMLPDQCGFEPGNFFAQGGRHGETLELKPNGRWPANLLHDGSPEVVAMFPDSDGQVASNLSCDHNNGAVVLNGFPRSGEMEPRGDTGSAARFFFSGKATRADREEGLADFLPQQRDDGREPDAPGANNPRNRGGQLRSNVHPTVKGTALMRWLVRLVTPPGGTVLDPFAGSGSTGKACAFERLGFVGVEQDAGYAAIARARITWAEAHRSPEQLALLDEAWA